MTNNEPPAFTVKVESAEEEKPKDPTQNLKDSLKIMKETMSMQLEIQRVMAKLQREKFQALVKEGFTPDQALFLCK